MGSILKNTLISSTGVKTSFHWYYFWNTVSVCGVPSTPPPAGSTPCRFKQSRTACARVAAIKSDDWLMKYGLLTLFSVSAFIAGVAFASFWQNPNGVLAGAPPHPAIPKIASGEDRALIAALRRVDARIRHSPGVHVTVSGRIEGRSKGGMADTIRRRMVQPDDDIDDRLEHAADCAHRARCRADLRRLYDDRTLDQRPLAGRLGLGEATLARCLGARYFGQAWEAVEREAPRLIRRPVPVAALAAETVAAEIILAGLRQGRDRAGRSDIAALEPETRD